MSKASNHSKQLKKRKSNQLRTNNSTEKPASQTIDRKQRTQTRSRQRREAWLKKRTEQIERQTVKTRQSTATMPNEPLVRGSLQRVLTKTHGRSSISEISREATAGGVIYRINQQGGLEILLVADHFDRWTIPKGHIEEGETAQETAIREIGEEAGVHQLEPICWLGKIHFRYRRENILVLMSTQIYLFKALGDTDDIKKEDWMNGIKWFSFDEAVEIIAYRDIAKLMRLAHRRLEQKGEIDGESKS